MNRKDYAIVFVATLALVGGYFVVLTPGEAQEQPVPQPPSLFTAVDIPDWQDPLLPGDTPILRSRPVAVNSDTLALVTPASPNADPPTIPIRFNLFDDLSVTVVFHKAHPRYAADAPQDSAEPIGYTWSGDVVGEQQGYAVMVSKVGVCTVNMHIAGTGWFRVRRSGDLHVVREMSGTEPSNCGVVA